MKVGIVPNRFKENISVVVREVVEKLELSGIEPFICKSFEGFREKLSLREESGIFLAEEELCSQADIIIAIGGDGTVLNAAFKARKTGKPVLGINFGKLGFLAEYEVSEIENLINDLKTGNYQIEERMTLEALCPGNLEEKLYAINDFVVDKGIWPKMIEITMKIDDDYVSTFTADGLIIATPTGSTGYSLSAGGPIVSPKTEAITLSPIAPHSLTMRPLVISGTQEIRLRVRSMHTSVQINSDGQRVDNFAPPVDLVIKKSRRPAKLLRTKGSNYFETLRRKLLWGLDLRSNGQTGIKG